jgi:hypothetical protein
LSQFRVINGWRIHAFLTFVDLASLTSFSVGYLLYVTFQRPDRPETHPQRFRLLAGRPARRLHRRSRIPPTGIAQRGADSAVVLSHVSRVEQALLIAVCLLALIVELLNSAVEAAIDRISLELHPLSKNAKDMGSAAQFVALTMIALVWAVILL